MHCCNNAALKCFKARHLESTGVSCCSICLAPGSTSMVLVEVCYDGSTHSELPEYPNLIRFVYLFYDDVDSGQMVLKVLVAMVKYLLGLVLHHKSC